MALTFNGLIPLIPDILIDNFEVLHKNNQISKKIKYCFISHAHSDHYQGLAKHIEQSVTFIMTKTTKELIVSHSNTNVATKRNLYGVLFAKMNIPLELEPGLQCTFIPNYHCLGSSMILLKDSRNVHATKGKIVLYTGDARFEDSVIYSIRTSTPLSSILFGDERINILYLDTTFAYRNRNIEIMENIQGIQQLVTLINKYPNDTKFRFLDTVYGFEEVWCKIFDIFQNNCNFFICKKLMNWIEKLKSDHDVKLDDLEKNVNVVDKILKLECIDHHKNPKYTFFFGDIKEYKIIDKESIVDIKHAIDLTKQEYEEVYLPRKEYEFEEIIKDDSSNTWRGKFWFDNGGHRQLLCFRYLKDEQSDLFLPLHIKFIYSRHSSYSETLKFVEMFKEKIDDLYPMTESFDTWQRGFNMKNFFNVKNSSYDRNCIENYGSCNLDIRSDDGNLEITDYWNSNSNSKIDTSILNSFNSISTDVDFDFDPMGQDIRKQGIDLSFDSRKQNLVAFKGRVIQAQKKEKRRRNERFLQNTDTSNVLTDTNNDGNDTVKFIKLDYGDEKENDEPTGNSFGSGDLNRKYKRKKVMALSSTLEDVLSDINFM